MKRFLIWVGLLVCLNGYGQQSVSFVTMNCYWFFGEETSQAADKPVSKGEYSLKAGHLIGLLPNEAPLFVGLQEIGNDGDVAALAYSAKQRYKRTYQPLFVQGKDTATKQDVGAILDVSRGWGVYGKPARVSELEQELSKHLVVRLTNAVSAVDICVVHLRRPIGADGIAKQQEQNRALLRWSMRHLANDPKANVIILGDFNEGKAVGSPDGNVAVLFQAKPPMFDSLTLLDGKIKTHTDGKAYDRIFVSEAINQGNAGLKLKGIEVLEHRHGKKDERRLYTDHFPTAIEVLTK